MGMSLNGNCYQNCLASGRGPPYCLSLCSSGTSGGNAAGSNTGKGIGASGVPGTGSGNAAQNLIASSVTLSELFDRYGNALNSLDEVYNTVYNTISAAISGAKNAYSNAKSAYDFLSFLGRL